MLKLLSNNNAVLQVDDFYIVEKGNGLDELIFNISIYDENYPYILEEAIVEYEQPYIVKAIDGGTRTAKVKCQIDLDALKAEMKIGYSNNSSTLTETVNGVLPEGWLFIDNSGSVIRRTIEGDYTPYEIIVECANTYDVVFRFKPKEKQIYAYTLKDFQPLGAFASRELNLKEINYKGKSTEFYTRLYAYGKDGLSFADINDGKEYVDNFTYSDKIVCAVLRDARYTTAEGLLEAAKKQVEISGIPVRSYECAVYDLAKTNPEMYSFQDFSLFSVVKLIDDIKKVSINYQVVEYQRYPNYPEKNVVTLSTTSAKLQNTVKNLKNEIENPQSSFRVTMQNIIDNLAASIAGYDGGNLLVTHNKEGKPNGFMIMDTESKVTAKRVLWLNLNGITYSENGADGPYNTVWSFEEGGFIADWIVAGTLLANRIRAGLLTDEKGSNYWDLDKGVFGMKNGLISVTGRKIFKAEDYTADDVTVALEICVNKRALTVDYLAKYDLDGDGEITAADATKIAKMVDGEVDQYVLDTSLEINAMDQNSIIKTLGVAIGVNGLFSEKINSKNGKFNMYRTVNAEGDEATGQTATLTIGDKTVQITNGIITSIT